MIYIQAFMIGLGIGLVGRFIIWHERLTLSKFIMLIGLTIAGFVYILDALFHQPVSVITNQVPVLILYGGPIAFLILVPRRKS